jgi:hypothetical protein
MNIRINGNRRTFSIDCLGGAKLLPIRTLALTGLFTALEPDNDPPIIGTPPIITKFDVELLPSSLYRSRQALSSSIDTSYDNPRAIGLNTETALFSKFDDVTNHIYEDYFYDGSATTSFFQDINRDFVYSINLVSDTVYVVIKPKSLLTETEGKININIVPATDNPETGTLDYVGIPENFREFIIDASAFIA